MTTKLEVELDELVFNGYLKYRTYKICFEGKDYQGGFVYGPGHEVAIVAGLAFDSEGAPNPVFKAGDTRLSRRERGEPYVMTNLIAGRLDHKNTSAQETALAELGEEVGASLVGELLLSLGDKPVPSTPWESTECDHYFLAAVALTGTPTGDGGSMELVELLSPCALSAAEALALADSGGLAEGGRTRTILGRAFNRIGWIPHLKAYVWDYPRLIPHFSSLGLGTPFDPRLRLSKDDLKEVKLGMLPASSPINDVLCQSRKSVPIDPEHVMITAQTLHAVNDGSSLKPIGKAFSNEYLNCSYDRAKVAVYYLDPEQGPLVSLKNEVRACLAFAPSAPEIRRLDIEDLKLDRGSDPLAQIDKALPGEIMMLGSKTSASGGQCDLYYHYAACWQVKKDDSFVTLAQALSACRQGQGDTHTEAVLQRLATRLEWVPELGMSYTQIAELI